jgi:uncharacterized membrane protein YedE/YeeE
MEHIVWYGFGFIMGIISYKIMEWWVRRVVHERTRKIFPIGYFKKEE